MKYKHTITIADIQMNIITEEETEVENVIWDGQGLLDVSVFEDNELEDYGMLLLRNRFFKSCAFCTRLQDWFKDNGITVRILNIPTTLIDFQGQEWIRDMINNIIVEVLSSIAEEEREKIHQRQSEGIAAAKAKGVKFGRPTGYTGGFDEAYSLVTSGEMTVVEACAKLNISRTQWYRMVKTAS